MNNPGAVGAGYVGAMLAGDTELTAAYERAFDPIELLHATHTQLLILGTHVARTSHRTPHELGDHLIAAAVTAAHL